MVTNQYETSIDFDNPIIKEADSKVRKKILKHQAIDAMSRRIEMSRNFLRGE